jgi:hypothetical protein
MHKLHVITPVKDSVDTALRTVDSVVNSAAAVELDYTVYNDFSTDDTTSQLRSVADTRGITLVNLKDLTSHPSPNYLLVLQVAQRRAVAESAHLLIVESDVIVERDTIQHLYDHAATLDNPGMIAAVTTDRARDINFPYLYARRFASGVIATRKRLSFCCTLLTLPYLSSFNFEELDPAKSWYDVSVSRKSVQLGFTNYLLTSLPVVHLPHSSRPWKQLKYTHPWKYWWNKLIENRDRI